MAEKNDKPEHFFVLAIKHKNELKPMITKVSFDKVAFKDFPTAWQEPMHHHLVTKTQTYRDFLSAIANLSKDKQCYRNVKLPIYSKLGRTEEAKEYLTDDLKFKFKSFTLDEETDSLVSQRDLLATDPATYTGAQLMQIYGKRICEIWFQIDFLKFIIYNLDFVPNPNRFIR